MIVGYAPSPVNITSENDDDRMKNNAHVKSSFLQLIPANGKLIWFFKYKGGWQEFHRNLLSPIVFCHDGHIDIYQG